MAEWSLRCRGPTGQTTLSGVRPDMSVAEFLELIQSKTGVPVGAQQLLVGFPPKPVQLSDVPAGALLATLPIQNGDSLTVSQLAAPPAPPAPAAAPAAPATVLLPPPAANHAADMMDADEDADLAAAIAASLSSAPADAHSTPTSSTQAPVTASPAPSRPAAGSARPAASPIASAGAAWGGPGSSTGAVGGAGGKAGAGAGGAAATSIALADGSGSAVVRRVIDSDNSCLFNAVGYVMESSRQRAPALRQLIADTVKADPFEYNEGFLGMENDKYCSWITQKDKWGGAIELSILCRHYGREIAAYDIQTCRCDVYGQGAGYSERVMLLYDGLHYDAMAVAAFESAPEELDVTIYEPGSRDAGHIEKAAAQLVDSCHQARQFTDTSNFTLRCGVCQIGIKGEKEAVEHAKTTGHQNFAEY